ncbi:hypothetical protein ABIF52_007128 [Bradyrhizobium japonicum]
MSNGISPKIGCISMPCRPSVPPVMLEKRSASASSSSAMPSVYHQPGEIDAADHEEAGGEAQHHRGKAGHDQREHGLVDDPVKSKQPRRIGADAEEGGVAERDDAGIAEDEIERHRKQRQPQDVGHDQIARGKCKAAGQHDQPEGDFAIVPARMALGVITDVGGSAHRRTQRAAVRPNRPFGRQIRITIIMV